ncbi:phosphopantetheine adenylyltransferase [Ahrensia marina]|uniref:Phosphopantetheine adenylyltransferase n=1 Tax=Ahrensia marina TaxID=1514904 RepID=A0A0N0VLZ5_9HYPH|nr:phosphopantetheine adenylyltransferase [Ahrensia marina]
MTKINIGFYSGSFDPITNGHMAVLAGALASFDHIIIGIGAHAVKKGMFDFDQRKALIEASLQESALDPSRVRVVAFDGLVVDAAKKEGALAIVRGLRDASDFDYEMQMAGMNAELAPDVQTIFIPATVDTRPISATLVRQIATMGGDVSSFVPAPVLQALKKLK